MKFSYRFYSTVPPEEIASRIAAQINVSFLSRLKEDLQTPFNPPPPPPGSAYRGKVTGRHFEIESPGGRRLLQKVLIEGDILPDERGSIIQVMLDIHILSALRFIAILWSLPVLFILVAVPNFFHCPSTLCDYLIWFIFAFTVLPAGIPWEMKKEKVELEQFFHMVSKRSDSSLVSQST